MLPRFKREEKFLGWAYSCAEFKEMRKLVVLREQLLSEGLLKAVGFLLIDTPLIRQFFFPETIGKLRQQTLVVLQQALHFLLP